MRELAPGEVVAGYRIESLVGRGGMGVVYRAVQTGLGRVVALKVIAPELLDDEDVRQRFLSEARTAASVDHPNVIPVHDAGEHDGIAYIAMRFVAGDDLRSLVRRGGALDPVEAGELVAQAGAALDAIHRAGFVHRDVKPANLLVDGDRHVYLSDFGLAKAALTQTGGTRTGHWVGTLDYIAPEQIRGGRIDARADVYALGGVLHYALTGRVPFEREGDEAKLWAQLSAPPPVPSAVRRGLPRELDVTVARAMAKHPSDRYPSAGDVGRAALAAAAGRLPTEPERMVARGAAAPGAAPTEPGLAAEASTRTAAVPRRSRRRRAPLVAAAAALVAAAVAALLLLAPDDQPNPRIGIDGDVATPTVSATASATAAAAAPRAVRTIEDVGDRPAGIALAAGDLWVASSRQSRLTRIDAATSRERGAHPKVGEDVTAIVAHRGTVWVALGAQRQVLRFDGRSGRVRARVNIASGPPRWLAVDASGLWVATRSVEGMPGVLLRYGRRSGRLLQTLNVVEGISALTAGGGDVWVVKRATNKLARLRPGKTALTDWETMPGPVRSMRYADAAVWVILDSEDTIVRVNADGRGFVTASAGHSPTQAEVAGGHVFVSSRNDHSVLVLDPTTLLPTAPPIRVGLNPFAMTSDAHSIWVTGLGDNTVTRIDYR